MRILIIQNPAETISDYSAYISTLITDYSKLLGYEIIHIDTLKSLNEKKENCIFILQNLKTSLPGFLLEKKIAAHFKKAGIDLLINLTEKFRANINLQQIIGMDENIFTRNKKKFISTYKKSKGKNHLTFITFADPEKEKLKPFTKENDIVVIQIPFTASNEFKTFEWPDKVLIKAQYAGNKEYFLCLGGENETLLLEVLKGFSKFKKWQQSSMQLILVMDETAWLDNFLEKLKSYRYKDDVQIIREINISQLSCLFASAYSFIHATNNSENLESMVSAMQCSLPLVCLDTPVFREYAGDAALYMPVFEAAEISKNMIGVYKNEIYKAQMEKAANEGAQKYKRDEVSKKLWKLIESLVSK
ncbi:MAG: glycosyltransferase [Chitinophagaceae bacterium]